MSDLPVSTVWVTGDRQIPVREAESDGDALGHLQLDGDDEPVEICVDPALPKVGKHVVLLHELLHVVELNGLKQGVFSEPLGELLISNLAGGLLPILALSGLWPGLTAEEVRAFYEGFQEAEEPK